MCGPLSIEFFSEPFSEPVPGVYSPLGLLIICVLSHSLESTAPLRLTYGDTVW